MPFSAAHVTIGNRTYDVTLTNGQLQVHLPFAVDLQRFSQQLLREGYPLAHEADTPDTQGWGPDFSANGYYPYWLYADPDRPGFSVLALNPHPEDVVDHGEAGESLEIGSRSMEVMQRWLPVLTNLHEPSDQTAGFFTAISPKNRV